ncbi:MAG: hypothetical protein PWP24_58, partial [Clostridiales bacterium]|nr:hypothetical protein [Clostridiales bacterium]
MRKIEYKIWITFLVTAAFFIVVTGLYALFN